MKVLYLDCFSGISGDMTVGALLDLGVPSSYLKYELDKLRLKGYQIRIKEVEKQGIRATKFDVVVDEKKMQKKQERSYKEIISLIGKSRLSKEVKNLAVKIFSILAEAEAKVHRKKLDELHFHELGAIDTIVDIVAASVCITKLGIQKVYCSPLPFGRGFIKFSHGKWPNPGPATAEILQKAKAPIVHTGIEAELVTPTGAAIVAALADFKVSQFNLEGIGYGAGTMNFEHPNVLRVMQGSVEAAVSDSTVLLETNIDDMNPQLYQYVINSLLEAGALDVFMTNIMMKKQRPGIMLSVICKPGDADRLSEIIFRETTTLGLRITPHQRKKLDIEKRNVKTKFGEITLKLGKLNGKIVNSMPEYDDCVRAAQKHKVPLKVVMEEAKKQV